MTVRSGPTCRVFGGVAAGPDRENIGAHCPDLQSGGDPGLNVGRVHEAEQEQDIDQFSGAVRI